MKKDETSNTNSSSIRVSWLGVVTAVLIGMMLLTLFVWRPWQTLTPSFSESDKPRILYLGWEKDDETSQLYLIHPDGSARRRLTDDSWGVLDYAVSPNGKLIAYAVVGENGNADIWQIGADGNKRKRLLACPDATCTQVTWAPDSRRLIYERRDSSVPGEMPTDPQLWWLDSQTGETVPVFADEGRLGLGARISPNGRYLSYISPGDKEIYIVEIATGEELVIASQTGEPGTWSLDSEQLLVNDIQFQGEQFSVHLFSTDIATAELTNISGVDLETNDGSPVFSPDGEWIAFGRKKPRAPMGKQLWLMRPDGSESIAITENADIHYNNPAWSPDGSQIVVQGYDNTEPESFPGLWLVDVETGALKEFESSGTRPTWLP